MKLIPVALAMLMLLAAYPVLADSILVNTTSDGTSFDVPQYPSFRDEQYTATANGTITRVVYGLRFCNSAFPFVSRLEGNEINFTSGTGRYKEVNYTNKNVQVNESQSFQVSISEPSDSGCGWYSNQTSTKDEAVIYYCPTTYNPENETLDPDTCIVSAIPTPPTVNVTNPAGLTSSYQLDYTAFDETALDSCWYNIDNGTNITLASCGNSTFNVTDGSHVVYVFANDTSGSIGQASSAFTLDTFGAVMSWISPSDFVTYPSTVLFSAGVSDPSGVNTCELELDGTNYTMELNSSVCSYTKTGMTSGSHSYKMFATDALNNTNSMHAIVINSTIGINTTQIWTDVSEYTGRTQFPFMANASGILHRTEASFRFCTGETLVWRFGSAGGEEINKSSVNGIDGVDFVTHTQSLINGTTYSFFLSKVGGGCQQANYDFASGRILTVYGLTEADKSVFVDADIPLVNILSPTGSIYTAEPEDASMNVSIEFSAEDNDALDTCWYSIDGGSNVTLAGCANTSIIQPLGSYSISVYANDSINNIGSDSSSFTIIQRPHTEGNTNLIVNLVIVVFALVVMLLGFGVVYAASGNVDTIITGFIIMLFGIIFAGIMFVAVN